MQTFIGLLTALLGSAGFALIFNVRKQLLPLAALGGALHKFRRAFVHPVDGICGHCTKNADQRSDSECVQEAVQHTSGNINLI